MACDCTERMNAKLAARNGRLATAILLSDDLTLSGALLVATEKLDKAKRKPVPAVIAIYCPFCGVSLECAEGA